MSYLVLARKYRPNLFCEMIGQDHIARTLSNAIINDRLHHAYLFCGVRGLGKTTVARILARALVCENGPIPDPCNQCEHCRAVIEGRSVDVREIDGASNNSVDDIRNLREQVQYLPQSARRKIYIIDEVHMLSNSAFNALLKTLEEPPPHVTFIFATTDPQKVLGTILSRVSRLDFRRVSIDRIADHLSGILKKEKVTATDDGLNIIASCADGSVRDALTLLDKVLAFSRDCTEISTEEIQTILGVSDPQATRRLVQAMLTQDASESLQVLQLVATNNSDLLQFAISVLQALRDLAIVLATGGTHSLIDTSESHRDFLQQQAKKINLTQVGQVFDRFSRVADNMDRSRIPRLLLEMTVLEIIHTPTAVPISTMIERLEALSNKQNSNNPSSPPLSSPPNSDSPSSPPLASPKKSNSSPSTALASPCDSNTSLLSTSRPTSLSRDVETKPQSKPNPAAFEDRPTPSPHPASSPATKLETEPPQDSSFSRENSTTRSIPSPPSNSEFEAHLWKMVQKSDHTNGSPVQPSPACPTQDEVETEQIKPPRSNSEPSHDNVLQQPSRSQSSPHPSKLDATKEHQFDSSGPGQPPQQNQGESKVPSIPPASSIPPPVRAPSNWGNLPTFDQWEAFLNSIRSSDDLLFAVLAQSGLIQLKPERLELALPKSGIAAHQIEIGTELRTRFQTSLQSYFGTQPTVEFSDRSPSIEEEIPSLQQIEAVRERKLQEDREREAREHPQIRALLSSFSAKLGPVTPVSPP